MPIELLRFFAVSAICATIDLGLSIAVVNLCHFPIYVAATIGWGAGVISGYLFHQYWTFNLQKTQRPWERFRLYFLNCIIILLTRWLVIALAQSYFQLAEGILVLAVTVTFALNYLISKTLIFR